MEEPKSLTVMALFGYSDNEQIVHLKSGVDYCDFLGAFADDQRLYGFARIETGDEMSKRAKFVFITWIGDNVSPLKKAKNFAIEVLTSDVNDLKYETLQSQVDKVGGAHYGTGK
ncbi:Coactosin-like protein [Exaiptasia diaphana]|nr:Coactosin-like protein [Exaiptasia diaphana]